MSMDNTAESYTPEITPETYTAADMATVLREVDKLAAEVATMRKEHAAYRERTHAILNQLLPDERQLPVSAPVPHAAAVGSGGNVGAKVRSLLSGL